MSQTGPLVEGIVVGGVRVAAAGKIIPGINAVWNFCKTASEKNRVHRWLTDNVTAKQKYRTTRAIASCNNLTEDRVRYLCSIDDRIHLSTGEKEDRWGLNPRE